VSVVVVGQVGRDLVLGLDELPEAGGSADVRGRRELLGGKGANQPAAVVRADTAEAEVVGTAGGRPDLDLDRLRGSASRARR
jgi:ribokinase